MAAHTRIADARKRAPPLMAARMGRGISGGFQAASPLTERSWNQASRTSITQVPPCASGAAIPAAVQSTPSTLEQLAPLRCAGSVAPPITGSACSLWRNHQRIRCMSHGLIIYGLGTRWWRTGGCMSIAGHSQVRLGGVEGYLTRGIPGGRSVVRVRALLLTPKELTKVLHIGCHRPGMMR
jgi:hypothetical protein